MKLTLTPQRWDMVAPFVTAGETVNHIDVLHVMLEHEGLEGRAETMGVDYFGETVASLQAELSALDPLAIEQLDREAVHTLLPPGGSRNGLDCALWDLQAKPCRTKVTAAAAVTAMAVAVVRSSSGSSHCHYCLYCHHCHC